MWEESTVFLLSFCLSLEGYYNGIKTETFQDYSEREITALKVSPWNKPEGCPASPVLHFWHRNNSFVTLSQFWEILHYFEIAAGFFSRASSWYLFADPIHHNIIHQRPWITSDFISALCSIKMPLPSQPVLTDLPKILLGKLHSLPNLIKSAYLKLVSKRDLGQALKQVNDSVAYCSKSDQCVQLKWSQLRLIVEYKFTIARKGMKEKKKNNVILKHY